MINNNYKNNMPDEREQLISLKSCLAGFIFLLVCLIIAFIYNISKTGEPGWELWGFIGACFVIIIANRVQGNIEQPKDMFNRPLPTGNTKQERKKRIIAYALDSVMFGLVFSIMDIILFASGEDITDFEIIKSCFPKMEKIWIVVLSAVLSFIIMFFVSFIFNYLIGEKYKIQRYNKMIAKLDLEEDEE